MEDAACMILDTRIFSFNNHNSEDSCHKILAGEGNQVMEFNYYCGQ